MCQAPRLSSVRARCCSSIQNHQRHVRTYKPASRVRRHPMVQLTQAFDMEYLSGPDREELQKQVKLFSVWSHECLALPAEALHPRQMGRWLRPEWQRAEGPVTQNGSTPAPIYVLEESLPAARQTALGPLAWNFHIWNGGPQQTRSAHSCVRHKITREVDGLT